MYRSGALALALVCFAPLNAQAQERSFCSVLREVEDNAYNDFEDLQGRLLRQSSYSTNYAASLSLPGGDCRISHRSRGVSYSCSFDGGALLANQLLSEVSQCLGAQPDFIRDGSGTSGFVETNDIEVQVAYEMGDDVVSLNASQP